jgi:hypothetical protein
VLGDLGSEVDDVAETGCLLGYFLGANRDHAMIYPLEVNSNGWRQ